MNTKFKVDPQQAESFPQDLLQNMKILGMCNRIIKHTVKSQVLNSICSVINSLKRGTKIKAIKQGQTSIPKSQAVGMTTSTLA